VPYILVAPTDKLAIGRLATDVYNRHFAGARGLHRNRELALRGRLLDAGRNPVGGELLSYLFFAPEFIAALIELGRRDAQAWLDRHGRANPWRTEHPQPTPESAACRRERHNAQTFSGPTPRRSPTANAQATVFGRQPSQTHDRPSSCVCTAPTRRAA
jgi:hypothetical protein